MEVNLKECVTIHNRYELKLKDAYTGEVKQTAIAENVVLDKFWDNLNYSNGFILMFGGVAMGAGNGTPSASDTALFEKAFEYTSSSSGSGASNTNYFSMLSMSEAYPTSSYVWSITVPAEAAYVGELTEIGLVRTFTNYSNKDLWTHAMLQDAEGNHITVNKTDLDVLTITVTVYVTFGTADDNFKWYKPGPRNAISALFRNGGVFGKAYGTGNLFTDSRFKLCHCTTATYNGQYIEDIISPTAVRLGNSKYNQTTRILDVPSARMITSNGNGTYYNGLILGTSSESSGLYLGGIVYPNTEIFPNQTIKGISVGIGDGSTTAFELPLEYFIEQTDVVYIDGTPLQRGIDYTIDNTDSRSMSTTLSNFLYEVEEDANKDIPAMPVWAEPRVSQFMCTKRIPFTNVSSTVADATIKSYSSHVYKVSDSAVCRSINKVKIMAALPSATMYNDSTSGSFYNIFTGMAVYDNTPDMDLPCIGEYASVKDATTAILDAACADPINADIVAVSDTHKFICRNAIGGWEGSTYYGHAIVTDAIYKIYKWVPGTTLLAYAIVGGTKRLISVSPEAGKYETFRYERSEPNWSSTNTCSLMHEKSPANYPDTGSITGYTVPPISIPDYLPELFDNTAIVHGLYFDSRVAQNAECYVYYSSNSNERSFVVPIEPGHTYSVEEKVVGDRYRIAALPVDPRSITLSGKYNARAVWETNDGYKQGRVRYFTANDNEHFLCLYTCSSSCAAAVDFSIKDITDITSVNPLVAAVTRWKEKTSFAYDSTRILKENCQTGWAMVCIDSSYDYKVYEGCRLILSGANSLQDEWEVIHSIQLGEADAYRNNNGSYNSTPKLYADLSFQCDTYSYAYYKLSFDTSESTNPYILESEAIAVPMLFADYESTSTGGIDVKLAGKTYDSSTVEFTIQPNESIALMYTGTGITFTNPPSAGAIITMDVDIDRPFKNENFIIDAAMTLHFGDA